MRKSTVEECEQISIFTVVWQQKYHILKLKPDISVAQFNSVLAQRLENISRYSLMSSSPLQLIFTHTIPNFGGVRYWFKCPSCDRRVGKLYAPLSANEFKCRHCHNLTYGSSQTHNQRVNSLSRQLNDIYAKEGDEALTQVIRSIQRTHRGMRLFWKVYDKRNTPSLFLARKQREEVTYNKYVRPLLES